MADELESRFLAQDVMDVLMIIYPPKLLRPNVKGKLPTPHAGS